MSTPIFHIVLQRHKSDCAVAALASLLCCTYEEVLIAAAGVDPRVLAKGLDVDEIRRVLTAFGKQATYWPDASAVDLTDAQGILGVKPRGRGRYTEHAVVLSDGLVFDPAARVSVVWEVEFYLDHYAMKPVDLIEIVDEMTKEAKA